MEGGRTGESWAQRGPLWEEQGTRVRGQGLLEAGRGQGLLEEGANGAGEEGWEG